MNGPLFERSQLSTAVDALRRDLLAEGGPEISTMRNYRFAIVQYEKEQELELRAEVHRLSKELEVNGRKLHGVVVGREVTEGRFTIEEAAALLQA